MPGVVLNEDKLNKKVKINSLENMFKSQFNRIHALALLTSSITEFVSINLAERLY